MPALPQFGLHGLEGPSESDSSLFYEAFSLPNLSLFLYTTCLTIIRSHHALSCFCTLEAAPQWENFTWPLRGNNGLPLHLQSTIPFHLLCCYLLFVSRQLFHEVMNLIHTYIVSLSSSLLASSTAPGI